MSVIASLVLLYLVSPSSSLPPPLYARNVSNGTSTQPEPSWKSGPKGRGTYSLIISCLTTLSLCVWTAVHLNVRPNESEFRSIGRRMLWMVIAVFIPEWVLYCAYDQWAAARKLRNEINKLAEKAITGDSLVPTRNDRADIACPCCRSKPNGDDLPCLKRPGGERSTSRASDDEDDVRFPKHTTFVPWTMEQAYFAVLGGFAVKSRSFWYTDHLTFTPAGMLELARVGLLPTIPPESVQDKSKADALAKVLVLLQAGWFLVQSIARIARGLPLTLLEVHTIVHIACAFGMYVIWFKKPYNVNSAQICEDESVVNMAALFALNKQRKTYDSKVSYAKTYACVQTDAIDMKQAREVHVKRSSADVIVSNHFLRANRAADRLRGRGIHFTWAICEYGEARLNAVYVVAHRSDFGILGRLEKEVQRGGDRDRHFVRTFGFSKILAILYGGAHLSAWNAHFPTEIEKWLWRGSGIALAAAPIIYEMFELLSTPDPQMVGRCQKHLRLSERSRKAVRGVSCGLSMVPAFLSVAIFTIYPLVRVYLVAESFASLRNPPARTYETVEWTDFIPHAS